MRRTLVASILVLALTVASPLWADSEGPNNPATAANDQADSGGNVDFTSLTNVFTSNDSRASASMTDALDFSRYLKATNFSFALTNCDTVDGILLEVERREGADGDSTITDNLVKLAKGGTIQGADRSKGGDWPETEAIQTYGGSSDLWSITWACADITSSGFGGAISAQFTLVSDEPEFAEIDHMKITVTFTAIIAGSKLLITETRSAGKYTSVAVPECRVTLTTLYEGIEALNKRKSQRLWEAIRPGKRSTFHRTRSKARRACTEDRQNLVAMHK